MIWYDVIGLPPKNNLVRVFTKKERVCYFQCFHDVNDFEVLDRRMKECPGCASLSQTDAHRLKPSLLQQCSLIVICTENTSAGVIGCALEKDRILMWVFPGQRHDSGLQRTSSEHTNVRSGSYESRAWLWIGNDCWRKGNFFTRFPIPSKVLLLVLKFLSSSFRLFTV